MGLVLSKVDHLYTSLQGKRVCLFWNIGKTSNSTRTAIRTDDLKHALNYKRFSNASLIFLKRFWIESN